MDRRVQLIFSAYALVMLGILVYRVAADAWYPLHWAMLGVAALCCLLVFRCFVYVFTYSYALAAILNGTLIAVWRDSPPAWLLGGVAVLYGLRLLAFTWSRSHSTSYAPRVAKTLEADRKLPLPARFSLWFMCSLLFGFHLMAVAYAGTQTAFAGARAAPSAGVLLAAAVMLLGTVIEGVADWQKQRAKQSDPKRLVTHGLYRRWRHPNYAGETLVQLGLIIAGWSSVLSPGDAVIVAIAPSYIILLMIAEARRVDGTQSLQYGAGDEYQAWRNRSGSLLPRLRV